MAKVAIIEIEQLYGTNDTNRGNQMMAVAGEALAGYIKEKSPRHEVRIIQQKSISASEIKKTDPSYDGGDVKIDDQTVFDMIADLAERAAKTGEALVVGIRTVTPYQNHAIRLSYLIKKQLTKIREQFPQIPEAKVVVGGYHSSGMAGIGNKKEKSALLYEGYRFKKLEAKLQKETGDDSMEIVDSYIVGEGEETFLEVIEKYDKGESLDKTEGVIYRDEGGIAIVNKRRQRMCKEGDQKSLGLPEPHRKMTIPKRDETGRTIGLLEIPSSVGCTQVGSFPGDEDIHGEIGVCSSRGCPHACEFCSSRFVNPGTKMRFRDPKEVIIEIAKRYQDPEFKTNFMYFFDLTFNAYYREHANELCELMIKARLQADGEVTFDQINGEAIFGTDDIEKIHWFCLSEIFEIEGSSLEEIEKTIKLMSKAGCTKIGYGIEGFTLKDIIHIKRMGDVGKTEEESTEAGLERYARAAWVLKKTAENGIFTRGYFMWGTADQDETSFNKAKALLTMEIPDKIFESLDWLKETIRFIFNEQEKGDLAPDIIEFAKTSLGFSDKELSDQSRLLEIDHLRIAYETPYPNTDVAKERALRYYQYYRDDDGFFLHDSKGKMIPKIFTEDGKELVLKVIGDEMHYFLDNIEVTNNLANFHKEIDHEWHGITLENAIEQGWDDWELLTQEIPILDSEIPIEDMERHQKEFIEIFYSSEAYRHSMEQRAGKQPRNAEAIYAWQKFWNDRLGRTNFDFLTAEQKRAVEEKLLARAEELGLSDEEFREWIDKRILKEQLASSETTYEIVEIADKTRENIEPHQHIAESEFPGQGTY